MHASKIKGHHSSGWMANPEGKFPKCVKWVLAVLRKNIHFLNMSGQPVGLINQPGFYIAEGMEWQLHSFLTSNAALYSPSLILKRQVKLWHIKFLSLKQPNYNTRQVDWDVYVCVSGKFSCRWIKYTWAVTPFFKLEPIHDVELGVRQLVPDKFVCWSFDYFADGVLGLGFSDFGLGTIFSGRIVTDSLNCPLLSIRLLGLC